MPVRIVVGCLLVARVASADVAPTPFDRGRVHITAVGGTSANFEKRYYALGAGVGYFVLDGFELAIRGVYQFGDGPSISQIQPSVRYVVQPLVGRSPLVPYVGAFYNHWFVGDGFSDVDALGGRVGALHLSGRVLVGLGVAVERTVSACDDECWEVYPDITLGFSF